MGPLNCSVWARKFINVLVDYYSHWIVVKVVNRITTQDMIDFLSDTFMLVGIPSSIVNDNGVQFTSERMKDYLSKLPIVHLKTALHCPKANRLVERVNRMIKECIQSAQIAGFLSIVL